MRKKLWHYRVIQVDGRHEDHELKKPATLEQLQAWVGGYVELVQVSPMPAQWAYVNEEGAINGLPRNEAFGRALFGPVVLLPPGEKQ